MTARMPGRSAVVTSIAHKFSRFFLFILTIVLLMNCSMADCLNGKYLDLFSGFSIESSI